MQLSRSIQIKYNTQIKVDIQNVIEKILMSTMLTIMFVHCGDNSLGDLNKNEFDPADTVSTTPWEHEVYLPFDIPPFSVLRASEKKVYAHYFTQFPISIDNKDPSSDYYQNGYLSPNGEEGKHLDYGGFLRSRPIPREPISASNWKEINMQEEVRRAIAVGIDGFACDLLSDKGYHYENTKILLDAAYLVDPGFKILLMPDMVAFRDRPDDITKLILDLAQHPSALRLEDGRLIVSPYNAQTQEPDWWKNWMNTMEDQGEIVALVPLFQGWKKSSHISSLTNQQLL